MSLTLLRAPSLSLSSTLSGSSLGAGTSTLRCSFAPALRLSLPLASCKSRPLARSFFLLLSSSRLFLTCSRVKLRYALIRTQHSSPNQILLKLRSPGSRCDRYCVSGEWSLAARQAPSTVRRHFLFRYGHEIGATDDGPGSYTSRTSDSGPLPLNEATRARCRGADDDRTERYARAIIGVYFIRDRIACADNRVERPRVPRVQKLNRVKLLA